MSELEELISKIELYIDYIGNVPNDLMKEYEKMIDGVKNELL